MQTWLSLASDRPSDACLKQCGSVDDYCYRQKQPRASTKPAGMDGGGGGGGGGCTSDGAASVEADKGRGAGKGAGARGDGSSGGDRRSSRQVGFLPLTQCYL